MHAPDGKVYENYIRYTGLTPDAELRYDHGEKPDGEPHFQVIVTLADEGGRTKMTMRSIFASADACAAVKAFGAVELGQQTLDKLGERLKAVGFTYSRTLDAPRTLVFEVYTKAEHLGHWWSPKGMGVEVKELAAEAGGVFHYRQFAGETEWYGKFRYLEASAPERLVFISSFADAEGNTTPAPFAGFPLECYNIVTFTERDGKTTVNVASAPYNASPEELAFFGNMTASMNQGYGGTFDQLTAYLASLLPAEPLPSGSGSADVGGLISCTVPDCRCLTKTVAAPDPSDDFQFNSFHLRHEQAVRE